MSQVHSTLHKIIRGSTILQYRIATHSACVDDNPNSGLPVTARLQLLIESQAAWAACKINFWRALAIPYQSSRIYGLRNGIFFLGEENGHAIRYARLPSNPDAPLEWKTIEFAPKRIIDVVLNIDEYDLIAPVTVTTHPTQPDTNVIEVQLLQFSTAMPHPLARTPAIFVYESLSERFVVSAETAGFHFALSIAQYFGAVPEPYEYLYVFDWTTGERMMSVELLHNTYSGLIFLSPEFLLLPNQYASRLDVWRIPTSAPPPSSPSDQAALAPQARPLLSLALPDLAPSQYDSVSLSCRAEPNPATSPSATKSYDPGFRPFSQKAFHAMSATAVVNFRMRVYDFLSNSASSWAIFARRGDLLAACEEVLADVEAGPNETEKSRVISVDGQDEGSGARVERATSIKSGSGSEKSSDEGKDPQQDEYANQGDGETMPDYDDHDSSDNSDENLWVPRPPVPDSLRPTHGVISYSRWGSRIVRWLPAIEAAIPDTRWVTAASAGTRCVYVTPDTRIPHVLDFNPCTVRRTLLSQTAGSKNFGAFFYELRHTQGTPDREAAEDEDSLTRTFKEPVENGLQYLKTVIGGVGRPSGDRDGDEPSPALEWNFDGLLMDEDQIVGLRKSATNGFVTEIVVIRIGPTR